MEELFSRKFNLPESNYIKFETIKNKIIIGNSNSPDMNFIKWTTRYNGKYTKTAQYTIDTNGIIYNHFDPLYCSTIMNDIEIDKQSIIILLENQGWLTKNKDDEFIDWIGNIYNERDLVVERKWRGYLYWAPYTTQQIESVIILVNKLINEFNINKFVIPHNTKIEDYNDFKGVLYRSNINKNFTDLSPAWPCENFKYKIENEKLT